MFLRKDVSILAVCFHKGCTLLTALALPRVSDPRAGDEQVLTSPPTTGGGLIIRPQCVRGTLKPRVLFFFASDVSIPAPYTGYGYNTASIPTVLLGCTPTHTCTRWQPSRRACAESPGSLGAGRLCVMYITSFGGTLCAMDNGIIWIITKSIVIRAHKQWWIQRRLLFLVGDLSSVGG